MTGKKSITTTSPTALIARTPPALIKSGITDLIIAFPAGAPRADDDRVRGMQIYAEAVEGFHPAVTTQALRQLRFHNPRNPFPPTAQDVYELCSRTAGQWAADVVGFYIREKSRHGVDQASVFAGGSKPFEAGCPVPADLALSMLRKAIASGFYDAEILALGAAEFEAIPKDAFEPAHRKHIAAKRTEAAKRDEAKHRELEYLNSLTAELREARWDEILRCCRQGFDWRDRYTEEELISRARGAINRRLAIHGVETPAHETRSAMDTTRTLRGHPACAVQPARGSRARPIRRAGHGVQPTTGDQ